MAWPPVEWASTRVRERSVWTIDRGRRSQFVRSTDAKAAYCLRKFARGAVEGTHFERHLAGRGLSLVRKVGDRYDCAGNTARGSTVLAKIVCDRLEYLLDGKRSMNPILPGLATL